MIKLTDRSAIWNKRTMLVNLPKIWVCNSGLKKGDKVAVFITEEGNLLLKLRKKVRGRAND